MCKRVTISGISIRNFKCHASLDMSFCHQSEIRGDNATGKSSIYDALTWLLFNKDSHGSAAFEIKPLGEDGEVKDHEAITSVEATLLADGMKVQLRKELQENWASRRGSREKVFTGNTMRYAIDGVPAKKGEFDLKVSEICDEDTFRMLTSVTMFSSELPWQKRRAILMDAFGCLTDEQIMSTEPDMAPLLEAMGGRDLEACKKMWDARRKHLIGTRNQHPARIDELKRELEAVSELDFAAAEAEKAEAEERIRKAQADLDAIGTDSTKKALEAKQRSVEEERSKLLADNRVYKAQQAVETPNLTALRRAASMASSNLERIKANLAAAKRNKERYEAMLEQDRSNWLREDSREFHGDKCPSCGQTLPKDKLMDALRRFEADKENVKAAIRARGETYKEGLFNADEAIARAEKEMPLADKELAECMAAVKDAENFCQPVALDMDGFAEKEADLRAQISEIRSSILQEELCEDERRKAAREEIREANRIISACSGVLAQRGNAERITGRIKELREELRAAEDELETLETLLGLCEEFVILKAKALEQNVNGQFRLATFRLFRQQANGGIEPRCDVCYKGIPYGSLNSGAKINVGIDIINVLSAVFGVSVPLFIDNAESVTRIEPCVAQTIRLVVDESCKEVINNG